MFIADVSIPKLAAQTTPITGSTMTVQDYGQIDSTEPIFDGHRAVHHLTKNLAIIQVKPDERPDLLAIFNNWLSRHNDNINVHPAGPVFILPPQWF